MSVESKIISIEDLKLNQLAEEEFLLGVEWIMEQVTNPLEDREDKEGRWQFENFGAVRSLANRAYLDSRLRLKIVQYLKFLGISEQELTPESIKKSSKEGNEATMQEIEYVDTLPAAPISINRRNFKKKFNERTPEEIAEIEERVTTTEARTAKKDATTLEIINKLIESGFNTLPTYQEYQQWLKLKR